MALARDCSEVEAPIITTIRRGAWRPGSCKSVTVPLWAGSIMSFFHPALRVVRQKENPQ
jgi:hypothetical protein